MLCILFDVVMTLDNVVCLNEIWKFCLLFKEQSEIDTAIRNVLNVMYSV